MAYSFEFIADPRRGIVEIQMSGFFAEEAVPSIAPGMADALRQLYCKPNHHMTLVDVTGCQIQSQEVVTQFQKLVTNPAFRSRRLAFVTGSSMIKMQLRRFISDDSYARIFGDHSSARCVAGSPTDNCLIFNPQSVNSLTSSSSTGTFDPTHRTSSRRSPRDPWPRCKRWPCMNTLRAASGARQARVKIHQLPETVFRIIDDQHSVVPCKHSESEACLVGAIDGKAGRRANRHHHHAPSPDRLLDEFLAAPGGH